MIPSSRTPEGRSRSCPVCGKHLVIEPSMPGGDAPCPHCGVLLWFHPLSRVITETHDDSVFSKNWIEVTSERSSAGSFLSATESAMTEQWDVAVEMFGRCVRFEPDNLLFRQTLRGVEKKHYGMNGVGVSPLPTGLFAHVLDEIQQSTQREEWEVVDALAEYGLTLNPWHTEFNYELGVACLRMQYRDIARFAFECALLSSPNRDDIRQLIESLQTE